MTANELIKHLSLLPPDTKIRLKATNDAATEDNPYLITMQLVANQTCILSSTIDIEQFNQQSKAIFQAIDSK